MNWTTEKPTTPGWYATKNQGKIYPHLAGVWDMHGKLYVHYEHNRPDRSIDEYSGMVEWLYIGPAPELGKMWAAYSGDINE